MEDRIKEYWIGYTVIFLVLFFGVDLFGGYTDGVKFGKIVDMNFSQGKTSTGTGIVNGKTAIIVTSTNDEWVAFVAFNNEIVKVDCKAVHFYGHKVGDSLNFQRYYGRFTNWNYFTSSVDQ